ncbi:MAG: short chain dehydrogenase [Proteobacteria bacterium]|nr:short chain dehydrogenase [Pseudomonadota bacterium]
MRVLLIGASGAVGQAATLGLKHHDIVTAGRNSGDLRVDLMDEASVRAMFDKAGALDAVVCTSGHTHFGPLAEMTPALFRKGLDDKLMGQVNVVLVAQHKVKDGGSITLTSGILDRDPVRKGVNASAVNGALNLFVTAAALEMPRGIRINVVSPGLLDASVKKYDGFFPGHPPVSSARVGLAFTKAVDGALTGKVIAVD